MCKFFSAAGLLLVLLPIQEAKAVPPEEAKQVALALENLHYNENRKLDDGKSELIMERFLDELDPERIYFLQEDIDHIAGTYARSLDDGMRTGRLDGAVDIYAIFRERVRDRVAHVSEFLTSAEPDAGDGYGEARDRDFPWSGSEDEQNSIWKKRVAEELRRHLDRNPEGGLDGAKAKMGKKYNLIEKDIMEKTDQEVREFFLSSACRAYDPHSDYLGPRSVEEFDISMGLKLCGIGAVLTSEDGVAKIENLLPGGPAAMSGEILKGDKILSIGQGGEEREDVEGLPLPKIVDMIRGEEGTLVHIEVAGGGEGAKSRIVTLRREVVQLNDQAVKGVVWNSKGVKLGIMTIPSFYADGEGRSAARDAGMIVSQFEEMGVEAMILDLRQDGGGVLDEAVRMAGLFVPGQTVVQIRSPNDKLVVKKAPFMRNAWTRPLVVLVDRHSASASEIFAGAIQDHGAGVVVGDSRTFGKGTVQMVMGLDDGPFAKFFSNDKREKGAVKVTVQKFYRATGGSTQAMGVESDIVIPSPTDHDDIGEDTLPRHMAFDRIESDTESSGIEESLKSKLRFSSAQRIAGDGRYAQRLAFMKSDNRLKHIAKGGSKNRQDEGIKTENEGILNEKGTVVNTVRGGAVEVSRGKVGAIYEGNPMPRLPDEKGDLSLDESVKIVVDWVQINRGEKLADAGLGRTGAPEPAF
jgi:carboxyl-terminal processing protease